MRAALVGVLVVGLAMSVGAQTRLALPRIGARAAILIEAQSGAALFEQNADEPLPPASTTKIVTAWLLAQNLPPDSPVPISPAAAAMPGTRLGTHAGETYSTRDVLHALLLVSANDAAAAVAEKMNGTTPAFAARMNETARRSGATHTHFTNANGLPDPAHRTTARDLANITRQALQNPAFAAAARTQEYPLLHADGKTQILHNTNDLLNRFPGAEGVKTGWTQEAGYCFVGAVSRSGRRLISVVLHSPDWQTDTLALWKYGFAMPTHGVNAPDPPTPFPGSLAALTGKGEKDPAAIPPMRDVNSAIPPPIHAQRPQFEFPPFPVNAANALGKGAGGLGLLWLLYRLRKRWAMSKFRLFTAKRRAHDAESAPAAPPPVKGKTPTASSFMFLPLPFPRRSSPEWLDDTFQTPPRLLEFPIRRHARALLDAHPNHDITPLLAMLDAPQAKMRVVAAELLAALRPSRAADTLRDVCDDSQTPAPVRADAAHVLSAMNGDREEPFWRQMLLRENAPFAARALVNQCEIAEETTTAFRHALRLPQSNTPIDDTDERTRLQRASLACVLAEHGRITPEEAAVHFEPLNPAQREALFADVLHDSRSEWAASQLLETALHGPGTAALRPLLRVNPATTRALLDARPPDSDGRIAARREVANWLLAGKGDESRVHKMAEMGDELATHALQLHTAQSEDLRGLPPDVVLAAAQIVSLRLGYARHTQEEVGDLLRAASSGETTGLPFTQTPDLAPAARAYANDDVHATVQNALHHPHGPERLAAELTRQHETPAYQDEIAFWSDKTGRETRFLLAHTLQVAATETAQAALAARADDACPHIRERARLALRVNAPSTFEPASPQG